MKIGHILGPFAPRFGRIGYPSLFIICYASQLYSMKIALELASKLAMRRPQIWVQILTVFHAIGFTIDYANGFIFCYTIVDAIGYANIYINNYANDKVMECAIDYAIGKVNGQ